MGMGGNNPGVALAVNCAVLAVFGAIIAIPDPTGTLSLLVGIVAISIVGCALVDDSLRDLQWGIGALYAFGIASSIGVWVTQDQLRATGVYWTVLEAIAVLSVAVLLGTYLVTRHRGTDGDRSLAHRAR